MPKIIFSPLVNPGGGVPISSIPVQTRIPQCLPLPPPSLFLNFSPITLPSPPPPFSFLLNHRREGRGGGGGRQRKENCNNPSLDQRANKAKGPWRRWDHPWPKLPLKRLPKPGFTTALFFHRVSGRRCVSDCCFWKCFLLLLLLRWRAVKFY